MAEHFWFAASLSDGELRGILVAMKFDASSLDDRDRMILEHLQTDGSTEIEELCDLLGVTRSAIRQRLARLGAAGLIESATQSQRRGRPRLVYRITNQGSRALGENYRELVTVLWGCITAEQDLTVRERLLARVRDQIAERYRTQLSGEATVEDRVEQLASDMRADGYRVRSDFSTSLPILRETCCPFPLLADVDESICQVERQVVEQVVGARVEFRSRCRDGQGCCEFQVMADAADLKESVRGVGASTLRECSVPGGVV